MEQEIMGSVQGVVVEGEVACADAHEIAQRLGISPQKLGEVVDTSPWRFNRCQLGLFGYGLKSEGKSKIVLSATNIPPDIEQAIRHKTANGRISCKAAWDIAQQFKYPRLGLANIIEALGIRVTPCQLGCF